MYALLDCNNFFVSCERVFNPILNNRAVIVLSNNDGCAIARSNEAKALGIEMGVPLFKIKEIVRKHEVVCLSSNFALYGDLSSRVMSIISQELPSVEIYSVDEAFADMSGFANNFDLKLLGQQISNKIEKYTGIPVSIGVAPTRTLAKVANLIAKKQNAAGRVLCLDTKYKINAALDKLKIIDIWGIGQQNEKKLHRFGIYTAAQLAKLPYDFVKENFNIVMWRTVQELNQINCIKITDNDANKQQIMVSRSFGCRVQSIKHLQEALATYTSLAAEKLRRKNSLARGMQIFLHTSMHVPAEARYRNSIFVDLPAPTSDTRELIYWAKHGLVNIFQSGYDYKKVGIILNDLLDVENMQIDLFGHDNLIVSEKLMKSIDKINNRYGRTALQFAAAGLEKSWRLKSRKRSSDYTSSWIDLPVVIS